MLQQHQASPRIGTVCWQENETHHKSSLRNTLVRVADLAITFIRKQSYTERHGLHHPPPPPCLCVLFTALPVPLSTPGGAPRCCERQSTAVTKNKSDSIRRFVASRNAHFWVQYFNYNVISCNKRQFAIAAGTTLLLLLLLLFILK